MMQFIRNTSWKVSPSTQTERSAVSLAVGTFMVLGCWIQGANAQGWQNQTEPTDINGDGTVALNDLHIELNELILRQVSDAKTGSLPDVPTPPPFYDINGDGFVAPLDWLLVRSSPLLTSGVPNGATAVQGPVSIEFEFQDLAGAPINQIAVGSQFQVALSAKDLRAQPLGISTIYTDFTFDTSLASVQSTLPDASLLFVQSGTNSATGLDQLGGADVSLNAGNVASSFFVVQMQATNQGMLTAGGANGFALADGLDDWIDPTFIPDTLTIVPEPASLPLLLVGSLVFFRRRR